MLLAGAAGWAKLHPYIQDAVNCLLPQSLVPLTRPSLYQWSVFFIASKGAMPRSVALF